MNAALREKVDQLCLHAEAAVNVLRSRNFAALPANLEDCVVTVRQAASEPDPGGTIEYMEIRTRAKGVPYGPDGTLASGLNELGKQGWKLATIGDGTLFLLYRERPPAQDPPGAEDRTFSAELLELAGYAEWCRKNPGATVTLPSKLIVAAIEALGLSTPNTPRQPIYCACGDGPNPEPYGPGGKPVEEVIQY